MSTFFLFIKQNASSKKKNHKKKHFFWFASGFNPLNKEKQLIFCSVSYYQQRCLLIEFIYRVKCNKKHNRCDLSSKLQENFWFRVKFFKGVKKFFFLIDCCFCWSSSSRSFLRSSLILGNSSKIKWTKKKFVY